ncbi:HipA family kinase [Sphingomonas sp. CFBP8993]|uniref:HipA family kinase n=1 Tax=Sphingomonas sp. CFBP8993 TaxID=3096526 RepID=UPI002A6ABAD7|nr:HipA family kinase [Sphingomonas sp. CFBP8993]MDY0957871.1 HipA family kinase [Sphingomonas sp. CFBP8993]
MTDERGSAENVVKVGTVLLDAKRFSTDNVSATYRGTIQLQSQLVRAIIKDIPPKELANELLAAAIAITGGLPVPLPILAFAAPDTGMGINCAYADGSGGLVFGSADVGGNSVRQLYISDPSRATEVLIGERIAAWSAVGRLYGFDSWIANVDRNAGNLQFGEANEIWLIDHAQGFTGPAWEAENLTADREYQNKLQSWLTPLLSADRRIELARDVGVEADRFDLAALAGLATRNHVADLLSAGDLDAVLKFLAARATHVPRMASRALGLLA